MAMRPITRRLFSLVERESLEDFAPVLWLSPPGSTGEKSKLTTVEGTWIGAPSIGGSGAVSTGFGTDSTVSTGSGSVGFAGGGGASVCASSAESEDCVCSGFVCAGTGLGFELLLRIFFLGWRGPWDMHLTDAGRARRDADWVITPNIFKLEEQKKDKIKYSKVQFSDTWPGLSVPITNLFRVKTTMAYADVQCNLRDTLCF